jgi:hypothetical protein
MLSLLASLLNQGCYFQGAPAPGFYQTTVVEHFGDPGDPGLGLVRQDVLFMCITDL